MKRVGADGELVADPVQQAAIETARTMRADGMKLEAIREALQIRYSFRLSMGGLHGILAGEKAIPGCSVGRTVEGR
jgi:hypothetical protein